MKYVRDSELSGYPECKDLMGHEELPGRGYHPLRMLGCKIKQYTWTQIRTDKRRWIWMGHVSGTRFPKHRKLSLRWTSFGADWGFSGRLASGKNADERR